MPLRRRHAITHTQVSKVLEHGHEGPHVGPYNPKGAGSHSLELYYQACKDMIVFRNSTCAVRQDREAELLTPCATMIAIAAQRRAGAQLGGVRNSGEVREVLKRLAALHALHQVRAAHDVLEGQHRRALHVPQVHLHSHTGLQGITLKSSKTPSRA